MFSSNQSVPVSLHMTSSNVCVLQVVYTCNHHYDLRHVSLEVSHCIMHRYVNVMCRVHVYAHAPVEK